MLIICPDYIMEYEPLQVRTTGVAGGLHWPYKGLLRTYALRRSIDSPTTHNSLAAPSQGQLSVCLYLPAHP